jgi:hypothetical protein
VEPTTKIQTSLINNFTLFLHKFSYYSSRDREEIIRVRVDFKEI